MFQNGDAIFRESQIQRIASINTAVLHKHTYWCLRTAFIWAIT